MNTINMLYFPNDIRVFIYVINYETKKIKYRKSNVNETEINEFELHDTDNGQWIIVNDGGKTNLQFPILLLEYNEHRNQLLTIQSEIERLKKEKKKDFKPLTDYLNKILND